MFYLTVGLRADAATSATYAAMSRVDGGQLSVVQSCSIQTGASMRYRSVIERAGAPMIETIYDAIADDDLFRRLPTLLAAYIGARSSIIQHMGKDGSVESLNFDYFSQDMFHLWVDHAYYLQDPWLKNAIDPVNLNRAVSFDEVQALDDTLNSSWFQELVVRSGDDTARCVGGVIQLSDGMLTIGAQHGLAAKPFTSEQAQRLDTLLPHFRRLYETRAKIGVQAERGVLLNGLLDAIRVPLILVNDSGKIVFANRSGEAVLNRGEAITVQNGRVRLRDNRANNLMVRCIAEAVSRTNPTRLVAAGRSDGGGSVHLSVTPHNVAGRWHALILVETPADAPETGGMLSALYGLSSAEAVVALALAQGATPEEIAERRQVSLATVRTQIQQALRKTGSARIADLIRLVLRVPQAAAPGG